MIPKIIHFCWFGGNPLSELAEKCIESWKKYCPDYEIIRWDESNFDVNQNTYCREAYEAKKWAFVSDYARLKVLYEYGGIYMDTDVEVIRCLDSFLTYTAFLGFESPTHLGTSIIASKKEATWIWDLLSYYDSKIFINQNGEMGLTPNTKVVTDMMLSKYQLKLNNSYQYLNNEVIVFPIEYFCPKDYYSGNLSITDNTHTIHHYNGSWHSECWQWRLKFMHKYSKYFGQNGARILSLFLYCIKTSDFKELKSKIKSIYKK